MFVWFPIILIAFLLAPTVPSEPSPQNLQLVIEGVWRIKSFISGKEVWFTSSSIPTVKLSFGFAIDKFSKIAYTCAGVTSFPPTPQRPPTMTGFNSSFP